MIDGIDCECAARSESECCCAGVDWRNGREVFLEGRVKELEGAIRKVVAIEDGYELLDAVDVLAQVLKGGEQ